MRLPRLRPATTAATKRLVVGLGNPGPQYRQTRHNVGFLVVDRILARHTVTRSWSKFSAELYELREAGEAWLLAKPQTYMNRSGGAVASILHYYDIPLDRLLVVADDLNLPIGRLRFRRDGSHGGQKGLADTIANLGTDAFARLRVGIGSPDVGDATSHVLGTFGDDEKTIINAAVARAAEGVETWLIEGIEAAMNRYNAAEG